MALYPEFMSANKPGSAAGSLQEAPVQAAETGFSSIKAEHRELLGSHSRIRNRTKTPTRKADMDLGPQVGCAKHESEDRVPAGGEGGKQGGAVTFLHTDATIAMK